MRLITQRDAILTLIDKVSNAYYLHYERQYSFAKISKALELDVKTVRLYARKGKELLETNNLDIIRDLYYGSIRIQDNHKA
jgi:DNA-directed RNA polymerase specialized sigma24 family protein